MVKFLGTLKRPVFKSQKVITIYVLIRRNRTQGSNFGGHHYDSKSLGGAREQNFEN